MRQTGGHGQYGHAVIDLEPLEPGSGVEFVDAIVGGTIPREFISAVEQEYAKPQQTDLWADTKS